MFSNIRKRLTWPNVALTLALVFVMTGGAYAANKYLITSTKQISPKVLKQLKGANGKAGANGAPGPAGPAGAGAVGPQGPAGATGKEGPAGKEGSAGKGEPGAAGESVTSKETKSAPCTEGGSEFKVGGKTTYACNGAEGLNGTNGKDGEKGEDGSPWTAGGVLPSGKTETGTWAAADGTPAALPASLHGTPASISFPIPLNEALEEENTHVIAEEANGAGGGCPTTSSVEKPEAEPGNLCIFIGTKSQENIGAGIFPTKPGGTSGGAGIVFGAGKTGSVLLIVANEETKSVRAYGTWAVTAK